MKESLRYRILGFILAAIVLFPYTAQAFHALENHEHKVCNAKDVKHFHSEDLDCSIYHTPVENHSDGIDFTFKVVLNKKFDHYFENKVQATSYGYLSLKSSRAPPYFIV